MPRRPRMYIPGLPYHIVQRGNNRERCFFENSDYEFYLDLWKKFTRRYGVDVHAYCLMSNHIHFLATPDFDSSLSDTLRVVGSTYARYINEKYERTGSLWEGRHHASLVESEKYLLCCMRYVELNPVRAGIVSGPADYPWSSHRLNLQTESNWLSEHPVFQNLALDDHLRAQNYASLFNSSISEKELRQIRQASLSNIALATKNYLGHLQRDFGFHQGRIRRGRPPTLGKSG